MTWTSKHLGFCIEKGFTPTAIKFYEWLLTQMDEGTEEIIDVGDFNKYVTKRRGKPHDNRIVRRAVEQLIDSGVLINTKKFTNFLWKWTVKRIDFLLNPKPKISQTRSLLPKKDPSNPSQSDPCGQAATADLESALLGVPDEVASNLEQCLTLCEEAGINYEPEDVSTLVELIQQSGWIKPIVVSQRGRIISGHRRWKAALELRWLEVPIIVQEFSNEVAELEALLLENASRDKTAEQKVREGRTWESIEGERALLRQKATQNNNAGRAVVENFPQLVSGGKGKTRDAIALRVGLGSGRNYDKAHQVVEEIDKLAATHFEQNQEFARVLRHTLNKKSVHAAYQLIRPLAKVAAGVL